MIIKMQPKEWNGKPLITEDDPSHEGDPEVYLGRFIVEVWYTPTGDEGVEPLDGTSFGWSVDEPESLNMSRSKWIDLLLSGVRGAMRHAGDSLRYSLHRPS